MKKILTFLALGLVLVACNNDKNNVTDNGSVKGLAAKNAGVMGAKTLAVAAPVAGSKSVVFTKADGDGADNALYKVSADNKFIEVSYTFEVETEGDAPEQTVIETIKRSISIVPNFIYSVGGGEWLWLANCFMEVPGYGDMKKDGVKKILTRIRDEFRNKYQPFHGAHYLINKTTGAMYLWDQSNGAPASLSDGYNPPSMLDDWFVPIGNEMYIREGGYNWFSADEGSDSGRIIRVNFGSAGPQFTEVIPASKGISRILPGQNCLGLSTGLNSRRSHPAGSGSLAKTKFYVYVPSTGQTLDVPFDQEKDNVRWALISVNRRLYALQNNQGGGNHRVSIHEITVGDQNVTVAGNPIAEVNAEMGLEDEIMNGWVSSSPTYTFFADGHDGNPVMAYTFDPAKSSINSRSLPEHYPYSAGGTGSRYFEEKAYVEDGDTGFWICDLTKNAAEHVDLDKSGIASYNVSSMRMVHFEAGNMTMKYECSTPNGTIYAFAPVTGANRGKLAVITGYDGSSNYNIVGLLNL